MACYDVAIIGDGAVGHFIAKELADTNKSVIHIGDAKKSASRAAGAMNAVFAELEHGFDENENHFAMFQVALQARNEWKQLFKQETFQTSMVANDTLVYLKTKGSEFENLNFETVQKWAAEYGCAKSVTSCQVIAEPNIAEQFILEGEFAFNPEIILNLLNAYAQLLGVEFYKGRALEIQETKSSEIEVRLCNQEVINAKKVVIASGAFCSQIKMPKDWETIPVFAGVGTAIHTKNKHKNNFLNTTVVRTVNRGGAQCGVHTVPLPGSGFYIGAGNYLTSNLNATFRPETIRYLTSRAAEEILGENYVYGTQGEFVLGYRPRSLDNLPLVGALSNDHRIIYATGFNRVGFTIAPVVAKEIVSQICENSSFDHCPSSWCPSRTLHSFGDLQHATKYYADSRIANLHEHGLINLEDEIEVERQRVKLEEVVKNINTQAVKALEMDENFVFDPDSYSFLLEKYHLVPVN